ncbi:DUF742 domain-containing protein [Saccharopolyspora endophytica]|uniref:DUF742 domain-containing protein n=1 Tax=Saccharopolyspora endophytica TaxID=543886 RepID=A0ABS5DKB6_9PSEU|nr:DUF742 domain-containing protein [Saccharopolyspora endophytica]MBQ0926732.1 DUF742 domain-containing protein [Saccharopolyspora endophytica]
MLPSDGEFALRIRPYLVTGGRTAVDPRLRVDSTVRTTGRIAPEEIRADHAEALQLCAQPASVAEIAARLGQPVPIAKVLLSDLLAASALTVRSTPADTRADAPGLDILEVVLDGLRKL